MLLCINTLALGCAGEACVCTDGGEEKEANAPAGGLLLCGRWQRTSNRSRHREGGDGREAVFRSLSLCCGRWGGKGGEGEWGGVVVGGVVVQFLSYGLRGNILRLAPHHHKQGAAASTGPRCRPFPVPHTRVAQGVWEGGKRGGGP